MLLHWNRVDRFKSAVVNWVHGWCVDLVCKRLIRFIDGHARGELRLIAYGVFLAWSLAFDDLLKLHELVLLENLPQVDICILFSLVFWRCACDACRNECNITLRIKSLFWRLWFRFGKFWAFWKVCLARCCVEFTDLDCITKLVVRLSSLLSLLTCSFKIVELSEKWCEVRLLLLVNSLLTSSNRCIRQHTIFK